MNDSKIKQQIAEKIKSSSNILVTVSKNPSVDELSAALGLTVLLNKLGKHATAVFSGSIPPAITFLDPEKTFESTVDSLRDFIIALDKEKADHLRYKVEGDVVKIFITPYRTTITSNDLEFSQGDYNVELVLALGVDDQDHLDGALEAHGRILHDATVATITAGESKSDLGSIDWHDDQASSLSEMLVSLTDPIKDKDNKSLLDSQIATAFLTGIVSATERFSNPKTTSKVMTIAAQLMSAGADQQLIAAQLQDNHDIQPITDTGNEGDIPESSSVKIEDKSGEKKSDDGELDIAHVEGETLEDIAQEVAEKNQKEAAQKAESELADRERRDEEEKAVSAAIPSRDDTQTGPRGAISWTPGGDAEPLLGGTLNATTEQAADDARRELEEDQNKTILTHSYLGGSQSTPPINSANETSSESAQDIDIFSDRPAEVVAQEVRGDSIIDAEMPPISESPNSPVVESAQPYVPLAPPGPGQTLADLDAQTRSKDHDDARAAVEQALNMSGSSLPNVAPSFAVPATASAIEPTPTDMPFILPPPPPLPDFSQLPAQTPVIADAYALDPAELPNRLGDILAPEPAQLPVQPIVPPSAPKEDPGQFRIPGQ